MGVFKSDARKLFHSKALLAGLMAATLIGGGCAHGKKSRAAKNPSSSIEDVLEEDLPPSSLQLPEGDEEASSDEGHVISPGETLVVKGIRLKNTKFDLPVVINARVEKWIDYFTGRGRKHYQRYLERSEYFIPFIHPILRENKMPEDLVYLAMIESGFNNHAASHAAAVGPWQFISATGKRYGLMVNWWVDERRDTRKSTIAAAEYLKDLYKMFGSWELAAAGYNAGEAKVARAIRRYGTKDFWQISRQKFLKPETRDYVPKMFAAAIIGKNREQFGFPPAGVHPAKDEVLAGDGHVVKVEEDAEPTPLAQAQENDETISEVLNRDRLGDSYEDSATEPEFTHATLTLPISRNGGDQPLAKPVATPTVNKKGEISGEQLLEFEVQSPADLLQVARAAGLSYQTVKSLNPELSRWCTPPTVGSYRIKLPMSAKDKFLTAYNHPSFPRQVQFMTYKVRKGETIAHVARRFGIRVDPISDLNGVSAGRPLKLGHRVILPLPNDRSRSLASLEVRDPPKRSKVRRVRKVRRTSSQYKVSYKARAAAKATARKPTSGSRR